MKLVVIAFVSLLAFAAQAQFIEHEERDKRFLVPLSPDVTTPHKVGLFTHMAEVSPSCKVAKSSVPVPLQRAPRDLSAVQYKGPLFSYTLKEHVDKNNVMGLMVVRDGKIIDQHYRSERRETDLFTSFSIAKSIISILIGIALDEGLIKSLDDPVSRYTSRINESSYSKVSIRSLLRMSSGIPFNETYTGKNDIYHLDQALRFSSNSSVVKTLNSMRRSSSGEGKKFNYASVETVVLAEALRGATGKSVCQFMQEKLWEKIGAEHDAWWNIDSAGNELGYAFFNATQLDYAKVAVMLANMGEINGRRVVSAEYVDEATNVERQPEGFKFNQAQMATGYGYQFWLREKPGRYFMQGTFGQYAGIDRDTKTVLIINSADNNESNSLRSINTFRLLQGLIAATNP
ncbi:MAG: serine hydrolase domain-containing protein [Betaproteobacteria bacterium]